MTTKENTHTITSIREHLTYKAFNQYHATNKHHVVDHIERLALTIANEYGTDSEEYRHLTSMYRFFVSKLPKTTKAKTSLQWVGRATSKDETRYFLHRMFADGKRVAATDGRRLHVAPSELEPGFYHEKTGQKTNDTEAMQFPNIDRVIPDESVFFDTITIERVTGLEAEPKSYRCKVISDNGQTFYFNKRYLLDATDNNDTLTLRVSEPNKAARVDYEDGRFAIIMPMQE